MKEIQKYLLQKIGVYLTPYGFNPKLADQAFERIFPEGCHSCHVSFVKHKNDFDVVADIAIRLDRLENLINDDGDGLSKKRKKNAYSFGCELGNLISKGQHRWSVSSTSDIEKVAGEIAEYFIKYGLPYLETYSDLENAFNLIAPHPERPSFHSPFINYRAKVAVGLALLLNKTDAVPALIADYEKQLEIIYPNGLKDFLDFTQRIMSSRK